MSHQAWSRFLSCAAQYNQSGLSPLGLVCDGPTGLVCLIKKAGYSFLRPVDALEQCVLNARGQAFPVSPLKRDPFTLWKFILFCFRSPWL